ncbi:Regulatory-associated protein of mTOR [Fasciolopsis buskii]|uniref:Regulatory-associated protein of mTOR n=1 Tax=Fasciolopsis buskii TaxID=27845 RepID=A0A8E0VIX3_9TREM|nr:Regulatory-associated protein of mTOR [Fasciolopsis buski]
MVHLSQDPHPTVGRMGRVVTDFILSKSISTSIARTSAFIMHSANFPSRRHHMVDQLLREPPSDHPTQCPPAQPVPRTPAVVFSQNPTVPSATPSVPAEKHPLDEIKTQLFAWSCRWFAQPLLAKYGGPSDLTEHLNQLDHPDSDSIVLPRRCPHPNRELAALGAVSVDPDAVAYADRLTRLEQQREITRTGRIRWAAVIGPRERTGLNVRGTKVDEESSLIVTPVSSIDPGFLTQVSSWQNSHEPNLIRFHPFLSHLVVADRTDLAVCSLLGLDPLGRVNTSDESDTVNRVFRPTSYTTKVGLVTDMQFLNAFEERSLLLTAHDDGRIRIWRNYIRDLGQDSEIVTAWTGINDLIPSTHHAGLVVNWSQSTTQLAVGGDARIIRLWDCERESRLRDISTGADACVTTLTRSPDFRLLAAGFGDGVVKVFDLRMSSSTSLSHHVDSHIFSAQCDSGWVHDVQFSPLRRLYATGSTGGVVAWQLGSGLSAETSSVRSRRSDTEWAKPLPQINVNKPTADQLRFRRLSHPQRISVPVHTPVHCAALKVDLMSTTAHILVAGVGGSFREVRVHRIHDGSVHSILKPNSTPISIAVHPNKVSQVLFSYLTFCMDYVLLYLCLCVCVCVCVGERK